MARIAVWLDRFLGLATRLGGWLAIPIFLALFAQWPLRDVVKCCSRETNDAAQWIFALYVATAVVAATRAGAHLRADSHARRYAPATRRRIERMGMGLLLGLFALALLIVSWPAARASLGMLERFANTSNPGYFMIKLAVPWMAALAGLEALRLWLSKGDEP